MRSDPAPARSSHDEVEGPERRVDKGCDDLFCIPVEDRYLLYMPLRGVVALVNAAAVSALAAARRGDAGAIAALEQEGGVAERVFRTPLHQLPFRGHHHHDAFCPTSVTLFLTSACTMRCLYCYADGGTNDKSMPWDMITGVLDEILSNALAAGKTTLAVRFHGGGDIGAVWQTLRRTVVHARTICEQAGLRLSTSAGSNGVLSPARVRWLVENLTGLTVSLDGPAAIQDLQRPLPNGSGSFSVVDRTLRLLDETDFPYGIRCTVTDRSVSRLPEIVAFIRRHYRPRRIKLEPLYRRGRATACAVGPPDPATFIRGFRIARDQTKEGDCPVSYSGLRPDCVADTFCEAADASCAVTPEGHVTSCYEVLRATDPGAELFIFGRYHRTRRRLLVNESIRRRLGALRVTADPFCTRCFCKWHCAGDCPAKPHRLQTRTRDGLPDRCYITRELTRDALLAAACTGSLASLDAPDETSHT